MTIRAMVRPDRAPIPNFVALRWGRQATLWLWVALASLCLFAAPALAQGTKKHQKPAIEGQLNVNRASVAELRLLPGIGKGRAKAIVERRALRPFASVDEVARMKGMRGVVAKLRRHLVTEGNTTLRPAERIASPPVSAG